MSAYEERVEKAMAGFHADMAAEAERLRAKILERLEEEAPPPPPPSESLFRRLLSLRQRLRARDPQRDERVGHAARATEGADEAVTGTVITIEDGVIVEVIKGEDHDG